MGRSSILAFLVVPPVQLGRSGLREDVVHEAQQELSLTSIYHTSVLKLTIHFFSSEDTSYYK